MDFQPWLPLFALLGGATGAAVINLGFGWWKVRADRRDEHSRWLRDQRQGAYADYLESTRRLFEWLTFTGLSSNEIREELVVHLGKVDEAQVLLLAPLAVRDAADALSFTPRHDGFQAGAGGPRNGHLQFRRIVAAVFAGEG